MLAIVAFTGVHSMSGVRDDSENLANRHLRAAELLGSMQQRAKDDMSLVSQHLYVNDGDLARQDEIAGELKVNWAKNAGDTAELAKLLAGSSAHDELTAYAGIDDRFVDAQKRAVSGSRAETVQNAEERDGSRAIFTDELLKLDDQFEQSGDKLIEAS
jgi:hypothetical protein